jgi:aminoglycoside phosphotransferase (APT) family kinase protein
MHGDYAPSNVMFAHQPPARLLSILDWELATIGDPMLDMGGLLINFRDETTPDELPLGSYLDATLFPTRQRLAAYYAELTGRDVSALDYYIVLAMFRYACLVEYKVAEAAMGIGTPEKGQWFARTVLNLFVAAKGIAQRSASR